MEETRSVKVKRYAEMHSKARIQSGKSQEYVALELGVSKKTVCNWENATSIPNGIQTMDYFKAIGINPAPYLAEFIYRRPNDSPSDEDVENTFSELMSTLPTWIKRMLLFIFFGRHGSSPVCLLNLTLAHIHSPLKSRVINAQIVRHNYEMADAQNEIVCKDNIMPDMELLDKAIFEGKDAAINNRHGYVVK